MKRLLVWPILAVVILICASGIVSAQSPAPVTVQRVIASGFSPPRGDRKRW